jgi:general stress protein YciG
MPKSIRGFIIEYVDLPKPTKGFASMSKEKRRAIASQGGISAHIQGKAHTWTKEEASAAGRRGGRRSSRRKW